MLFWGRIVRFLQAKIQKKISNLHKEIIPQPLYVKQGLSTRKCG